MFCHNIALICFDFKRNRDSSWGSTSSSIHEREGYKTLLFFLGSWCISEVLGENGRKSLVILASVVTPTCYFVYFCVWLIVCLIVCFLVCWLEYFFHLLVFCFSISYLYVCMYCYIFLTSLALLSSVPRPSMVDETRNRGEFIPLINMPHLIYSRKIVKTCSLHQALFYTGWIFSCSLKCLLFNIFFLLKATCCWSVARVRFIHQHNSPLFNRLTWIAMFYLFSENLLCRVSSLVLKIFLSPLM